MIIFAEGRCQALCVLAYLALVALLFRNMGSTLLVALASSAQLAGLALMLVNVLATRSVAGLSRHSFLAYTTCFGLRALLAFFFEGDSRVVKAAEEFFILQEVAKAGLAFALCRLMAGRLRLSYDRALDQLELGLLWVPVLLLAVVLHPSINDCFIADALWAFTHYFEVVALLPQLRVMRLKATGVERPLANFVLALLSSKLLDVAFWWTSYHDLNLQEHE
jgi:hypothetical protein